MVKTPFDLSFILTIFLPKLEEDICEKVYENYRIYFFYFTMYIHFLIKILM